MSAESIIKRIKSLSNNTVIGTDTNIRQYLPNANLVDYFFRITSSNPADYVAQINQICSEMSVDYVIPLTDVEVDYFNFYRSKLQPTTTFFFPSSEVIELARCKIKLAERFSNCGYVNVIPTYLSIAELRELSNASTFIAKPKNGRSSIGNIVFTKEDIPHLSLPRMYDYIYQPILLGEIFTVDIIRDGFDNCVALPRKEVIRTRHGAGVTVEVLSNKLSSVCKKIAQSIDLIGTVNIEFIKYQGDFYIMDFNPRFSAGIEFSCLAGYDFVSNNSKAYLGDRIQPFDGLTQTLTFTKNYIEMRL